VLGGGGGGSQDKAGDRSRHGRGKAGLSTPMIEHQVDNPKKKKNDVERNQIYAAYAGVKEEEGRGSSGCGTHMLTHSASLV
jgi:hypothetical protein